MATVVTKEERRDFSRIALHRPATIEVGGIKVPCALVDISLCGALVRVPHTLLAVQEQSCTLVVKLDHGIETIRMRGVIAHRREDTIGIRCREVDLDGIAHLRRLLEVNLGDDVLLHRELAALVRRR